MRDKTQVAALVRQTIATALGAPVNLAENKRQTEDPRWDSMKHVEIILMLEEAFGIVLDPEDFAEMTSVESCIARVNAHLERQAPR